MATLIMGKNGCIASSSAAWKIYAALGISETLDARMQGVLDIMQPALVQNTPGPKP